MEHEVPNGTKRKEAAEKASQIAHYTTITAHIRVLLCFRKSLVLITAERGEQGSGELAGKLCAAHLLISLASLQVGTRGPAKRAHPATSRQLPWRPPVHAGAASTAGFSEPTCRPSA